MARRLRCGPNIQPLRGSRPDLLRQIHEYRAPQKSNFRTEIDDIAATQIDDKLVTLLSRDLIQDISRGDYYEEYDDETESGVQPRESSHYRLFKTTRVYEQIGQAHPRLVKFHHRDPGTALPVLELPSGPTLVDFLATHGSIMYSSSQRIKPYYRPLIYQWALHLISGLTFVHSHSIVFGDMFIETCWLSSSLDLSLLGFLDAVYIDLVSAIQYINQNGRDEPFHPCNTPKHESTTATMQTDLFVWGCFVYQLMTGFWPGHELNTEGEELRSDAEKRLMVTLKQWPALEREYLGDIVRKCWNYEYGDSPALKRDLVHFLANEGWEIDGEDELRGFQATSLFED